MEIKGELKVCMIGITSIMSMINSEIAKIPQRCITEQEQYLHQCQCQQEIFPRASHPTNLPAHCMIALYIKL
jgi:hypothetical protein